jgi:hypothetical protein
MHWGVYGERACVRAWQKQPCGADLRGGGVWRCEMSVCRACTAGETVALCWTCCCWFFGPLPPFFGCFWRVQGVGGGGGIGAWRGVAGVLGKAGMSFAKQIFA